MENELINPEPDNTAMSALKAAVEALIYVAEEPVTLEQIVSALGTTVDEAGRDAIRQAIFVVPIRPKARQDALRQSIKRAGPA